MIGADRRGANLRPDLYSRRPFFRPDRRSLFVGALGTAALLGARARGALSVGEVSAIPRINQLGYPPNVPKRVCMVEGPQALVEFTVEGEGGSVAFQGQFGPVTDLAETAGEWVRAGDFSTIVRPGSYRVRVGRSVSFPFAIGPDVYVSLLRDAARSFYLIRANAALDDPVTGLHHAASHTAEATLPVDGVPRDLTGGWYNAGDYGKWTHMAAISVSQMMWLHELRPRGTATLQLQIPDSNAASPDLLLQARWGLEWMLKMQNPDGGVLHKVDSEPLFAWGLPPEADHLPRCARGPGSVDTAVFVGAMLQAARVYAPVDPPFAAQCRSGADRAWSWLSHNPDVLTHDPYYPDDNLRPSRLRAMAEMATAAHDEALAGRAAAEAKRLGAAPFSWPTPQVLGLMSLARSTTSAAPIARDVILQSAEILGAISRADPYGYAAERRFYTWGSVELALDAAVVCAFAAELATPAAHRATTQRLLDYVLGCNALGQCFITGHGQRSVKRPYHWTMRVWGVLMPGWTAGGPNGFAAGADPLLERMVQRETPPAKCYVDACEDNGSWASNEGQTTETAALVLALGLVGLAPG